VTLPNALSGIRAASVAPVVGLIALGEPAIALGIFALAAITDLVDGRLARRRHEVTALGTFLDPLADKILIVGTLSALALQGAAPAWAVGIVVARELVAVEVRVRSPGLAAGAEGKAKTVLQAIATVALLASLAWPSLGLATAASALLVTAVALTVLSGVMLVRRAA
jgi:CDP-diacylglycerol--glycerol-3-phosphate 3-phosphatidyltransferase